MRFMLMIKATGYSEAGVTPCREHKDAMIAYKQSLAKVGALLADEELQPSATGIRISYPSQGGEPEVEVGPFTEFQAHIAAYTLIEVSTEDEAVNWALRMPVPAERGEYKLELRRLEENSAFLREPWWIHEQ